MLYFTGKVQCDVHFRWTVRLVVEKHQYHYKIVDSVVVFTWSL